MVCMWAGPHGNRDLWFHNWSTVHMWKLLEKFHCDILDDDGVNAALITFKTYFRFSNSHFTHPDQSTLLIVERGTGVLSVIFQIVCIQPGVAATYSSPGSWAVIGRFSKLRSLSLLSLLHLFHSFSFLLLTRTRLAPALAEERPNISVRLKRILKPWFVCL